MQPYKTIANMMIPEFGKRLDRNFKKREATYAVILQNEKVAVVYDSERKCFLPGGGREKGESKEENVLREIFEECGRDAKIGKYIGEAIQYFICRKGEYYKMKAFFYNCSFKRGEVENGEHVLTWEYSNDIQFFHDSHRWALDETLKFAYQIHSAVSPTAGVG